MTDLTNPEFSFYIDRIIGQSEEFLYKDCVSSENLTIGEFFAYTAKKSNLID